MNAHPQTEELLKQARAANKEDRERAEVFQSLLKHPGWTLYASLLNSQLQSCAENLMLPREELREGKMNSEYLKGTMRGLIMARDLPSATIAGIEQLRTSEPAQETTE